MEAIYTYGPVSVIINANDRNFILYKLVESRVQLTV